MARRKNDDDESNSLFDVEEGELDAVLSGLPDDDSIITLWRLLPQGRPSYVAEFQPREFSIEAVKNSFGGGSYKYYAKSNGNVIKQGTFAVEGEPKTGARTVLKRYNAEGKLVFAKKGEAEFEFSEGNRSSDTGVTALLLAELRSLRETLQNPQQSRESVKKDFLEEMIIFKNLFVPAQTNPVHDLGAQAVDLIKQGIEIANISENGGSPWMMILDKVMPTIQDALKVVSMQQAKGIQRPPTPPQQETPALPASAPKTGFDAIADDLKVYLPTFIRAASLGTDPGVLIDMTLPNIQSAEHANAVINWLESESWFSDLVKLHPAISAQASWWSEYKDGLLQTLKNPQTLESEESEVQ